MLPAIERHWDVRHMLDTGPVEGKVEESIWEVTILPPMAQARNERLFLMDDHFKFC